MLDYIHTWKHKVTGEICKIGEGKIPTSMEEAKRAYYEEDCGAYEYEHTMVIGIDGVKYIDIREQIEMDEWEANRSSELYAKELRLDRAYWNEATLNRNHS